MEPYHVPVMLGESIEMLDIAGNGTYADLTFGGGGHSRAILEGLAGRGRLFGFDQDGDAKANIPDDPRFTFVEGNFRFLRSWLRYYGVGEVDGILADLGVSSHHFDTQERGFSFRFDAPLDMRMNRRAKLTAADVVNRYDHVALTSIFRDYGELDKPHKIAQAVERARNINPVETIAELIAAVEPLTPRNGESKFMAKLFQALRIEVNGELEALKMMLEQALKVLKPGGRLVVITYHSLEDRLVKNFMRTGSFDNKVAKDFYGRVTAPFELVTRKAQTPSEDEIERNPRSRSAKLRVAVKLPEER